MIFIQVLFVIFAYALNSVYPNELVTRFLLHTSILILILNLLLEKLEYDKKTSIIAALSAIMLLIPSVFLGFLANFLKINYSSTKIFSYIFLSSIISYLFFSLNLANKIKSTWKQLYQLLLVFLSRKKI